MGGGASNSRSSVKASGNTPYTGQSYASTVVLVVKLTVKTCHHGTLFLSLVVHLPISLFFSPSHAGLPPSLLPLPFPVVLIS